jgi:hypothetical protein
MKLKMGIFAILLGTGCLTGIMYLAIEAISKVDPKAENHSPEEEPELNKKKIIAPRNANTKALLIPKPQNKKALGNDEQIIANLVSLSDAELAREHELLAQKIKNEALVDALERKSLSAEQAILAKASLERFTLLSLEGTRRKYLPVEPELKDALFAHRDSLKDVRQILSRY